MQNYSAKFKDCKAVKKYHGEFGVLYFPNFTAENAEVAESKR